MSSEVPERYIIELLLEVLKVQKDYAHEQSGAETDRRHKMKKAVNVVAAAIEKERKDGN